jgi:hypothetical protein
VDTASGLISHVQADLADSRDSVLLPRLVAQLQMRLTKQHVPLREVLADTGYSNGFNYAFLEQRGITPWIPVFGTLLEKCALLGGSPYSLLKEEKPIN